MAVDADELRAILGDDIPADENFKAFIDAANIIIAEDFAGSGLSDERLALIALYLAAHFATTKYRQIKSEEYGDAETVYIGSAVGLNFNSSTYGQSAIGLDPTGIIVNLGRSKVEFELLT